MKAKNILLIIVLSSIVSELFSQITYLQEIKIENQQVVKENNQLSVSMDIVLNELKIKTNDLILLTPVLQSNRGDDRWELPPVVISGGRRLKVLERTRRLNNYSEFEVQPQVIVKRKNGTNQHISYNTMFPLAVWMKDASFTLKEIITGCAECDKGRDDLLLVSRIIKEDYVPTYKIAYIIPEIQPYRKEAKHSAPINFRFDKWDILPAYKNNPTVLAKVNDVITEIRISDKINIIDFSVTGYASPEGTVQYNKILSERRADSFADYLANMYGIDRTRMQVSGYGEDWNMVREQVKNSSLTYKDDILRIIDDVADPDARDAHLARLPGTTYRTLLRQYYPAIRRIEYAVAYEQGIDFDVEKAKQTFRNSPGQLSLIEFYLLARTYHPGSNEFKDLFRVASLLYPNDTLVIANAATADLEEGKNREAIDRLEKIEDDPRAWNILGVAHARLENFPEATENFRKAISQGDEDAKNNLEELQKLLEDRGE